MTFPSTRRAARFAALLTAAAILAGCGSTRTRAPLPDPVPIDGPDLVEGEIHVWIGLDREPGEDYRETHSSDVEAGGEGECEETITCSNSGDTIEVESCVADASGNMWITDTKGRQWVVDSNYVCHIVIKREIERLERANGRIRDLTRIPEDEWTGRVTAVYSAPGGFGARLTVGTATWDVVVSDGGFASIHTIDTIGGLVIHEQITESAFIGAMNFHMSGGPFTPKVHAWK